MLAVMPCVKEKRMTDKGGIFSFYDKHFKNYPIRKPTAFSIKKQINVFVSGITGV